MVLAVDLLDAVSAAIDRRQDLLARLHAEDTDCYRLFHGGAEGEPGLTIDRYGSLLLLQTFRDALGHDEAEQLGEHVNRQLGTSLPFACNHRGPPVVAGAPLHAPAEAALCEHECREQGNVFVVRARHRGRDPWLFLDLRAGRRAVRALARGRSVLNLFAYTCGVGVAAAVAGARAVCNVDFAASALAIGRRNAERNGVAACTTMLESDCIPVLRQLAGQPVQRRGRLRPYAKVRREPFDLVFLDPPRWAKGPFGAIDVVRDYASLFKPCLLTLADGGLVIATNHVPEVPAASWCAGLRRCADKAGRPLRELELLAPDADFPSFDAQPPLKIAICRVGSPR